METVHILQTICPMPWSEERSNLGDIAIMVSDLFRDQTDEALTPHAEAIEQIQDALELLHLKFYPDPGAKS